MYVYIYIHTYSPLRVNLVYKIPISKSRLNLANPVEIAANPGRKPVSSTGFASFDRVCSSGELLDRDRSKTSYIYTYIYIHIYIYIYIYTHIYMICIYIHYTL